MMATMMAIIDPGDEVVIFEPFYETTALTRFFRRHPALRDAARTRLVVRPDELAAAFNNRTKAIILNTPNNPTGKVFTRAELEAIAASAANGTRLRSRMRFTSTSSTTAGARPHRDDRRDGGRTVTINGLSKTYSVTGWRVGWTISPRSLTGAIRKVHDFLTVGAAALQKAGAVALGLPDQYYLDPRHATSAPARRAARDPRAAPIHLLPAVRRVLHHDRHRGFGFADDVAFARYLVKDVGVAAVPGSSLSGRGERPHEAALLFL
jgi:aminotransferase